MIIFLNSCPWRLDRGQDNCEANTFHARAVSREAPSEPGTHAQKICLSGRGASHGITTYSRHDLECRSSRTPAVNQQRSGLLRRVLYFLVYGLCLVAATATFVVIVLKISRARLSSLLSGGAQGVVLGIFSAPFTTHVFVSAMFVSRIFRDAQKGNQLDPRARREIRGLIMEVIEASVLYPAIILNVLKAHYDIDAEQDVLDVVYDASTVVLALGWIVLWFSGGQKRGTNRRSAAVQSQDDNGVSPRETNHQEAQGDASDTFDSFTIETALAVA